MATKKELQALIVLAGKVDPSLKAAISKATSQSDKLGKSAKKSASGVSGVGNIIKGVFAGNILSNAVMNISSKLVELGKNGIKLASDLKEVQNVVDVSFGKNAGQINKWSQSALTNFGLTELAAKQYTGTMGAMLKSSGIAGQSVVTMSEGLTGLAGDFASFYNLDSEEAFNKIRSGISGETEPLKQLGINMSVANLQAFALSKGIKTSYQSMDQASQTALRYSYLMQVSKDAQGDFARTQGSFANQSKLLTSNLQQLAARVASGVLPMLTKLAQGTNNFLSGSGGKAIEVFFKALFDNASSLMPIVAQLMTAISTIGPPIIDLIQQILPLIIDLTKAVMPLISELINIVSAALKPLIPVVTMIIKNLMPPIMQILNSLMPVLKSLTPLISFIAQVIGGSLVRAFNMLKPVIDFVANNISNFMIILSGLIDFITNVFTGNWQGAWESLGNIVQGVFKYVGEGIKGFFNMVIKVVNGAIGGINKIIGKVGSLIGLDVQIPLIPEFAKGGFTNVPSIFGEAGPEAAIPIKYKNPRSLSLLNQTARAIGADNSNGAKPSLLLNFNFYGSVSNKDDVVNGVKMAKDYIYDVIEDFFGDKGRESFD